MAGIVDERLIVSMPNSPTGSRINDSEGRYAAIVPASEDPNRPRLHHATIIFFFLYAPFLRVAGVVVHLPYYILIGLTGYFLWLLAVRGVNRSYLLFALLFVVGYVWILLISLITGVVDNSVQLTYGNGLLSIASAYSVAYVIYSQSSWGRLRPEVVMFAVFTAAVGHSVFMILAFFVPGFSRLLYSVVVLGEKGEAFVEQLIRSPGLTTGGGDALAVIQAIGMVFGLWAYFEDRSKLRLRAHLLYGVSFLALAISILLSARTGFVVVGVGVAVLGIRIASGMVVSGTLQFRTIARIALVSIGLIALMVIGYHARTNLGLDRYGRFIGRAFEPVDAYLATGRLATTSSDRILSTMYFLPESDRHLLIGTGNFGRDRYLPQIQSDVGYVRTVFGGGLIGTVLMYLWLVVAIAWALWLPRSDRYTTWAIVFLAVTVLLVNVKVFHFAGMRESFKVFWVLLASMQIWRESAAGETTKLAQDEQLSTAADRSRDA